MPGAATAGPAGLRARQRRQCQGSGDSEVLRLLEQQPTPQGSGQERRRSQWEALLRAAAQVRDVVTPATWQAFWHTAVLGQRGKEVARLLGMSVAAVYLAKARVLARLKAQLQSVQDGEPGGDYEHLAHRALHDVPPVRDCVMVVWTWIARS